MRLALPVAILPLWLALPLVAQEGAEPQHAPEQAAPGKLPFPPPVSTPAERLGQLLDDMLQRQDDDFYGPADYVLSQTGVELTFHRYMEDLAQKEHPVALYWLARSLGSGDSPYKDEDADEKMLTLLLKAADKGYLPAMVQAAQVLYVGGADEEARAAGLDLMLRACKLGSAKARARYLVMSGLLSDKDSNLEIPEITSELKRGNYYVEEAIAEVHWDDLSRLRAASDHGSAWAAYEFSLRGNLGDRESLAYLRLAAQRHMPEAMTTLGCLLCLGPMPHGHETDSEAGLPEKAWAKPKETGAAEEELTAEETDATPEEPAAGIDLTPTQESMAEGLHLLRVAAGMGDERAAAFVALIYAGNIIGEGMDPARIADLFRFSHEREYPYGTAGWGYCLVAGKGCGQDVEKGISLLQRVATQGVWWANLAMAHLYEEGIGVGKDGAKAKKLRKLFESKKEFSPFLPTDAETPLFPALR